MKRNLVRMGFLWALAAPAWAQEPEFDPQNRLVHEFLDLRPQTLALDPVPASSLNGYQRTMAIVAVCSLVLSAISLGYRISKDRKKD
jgi:hypothetical protein